MNFDKIRERELNNPNFVIYGLKSKYNDEIRYIGYTTESPIKRFKRHLSSKKIDYKTNWINSIGRDNIEFIIIEDGIKTHSLLCEREIFHIEQYKINGHRLTNFTNGGDGWCGMSFSDEHRKNISINHADFSGDKNPMFGKSHTDSTKKLLREINTGKFVSDDTKIKQSIIRMGEDNSNSSLTKDEVILIRIHYDTHKTSYAKLANMYGVKRSAIHKIIKRKTWNHI